MARIRHLAIASDNPFQAAAFYKEALGWAEIGRFGFDPALLIRDQLSRPHHLADGVPVKALFGG